MRESPYGAGSNQMERANNMTSIKKGVVLSCRTTSGQSRTRPIECVRRLDWLSSGLWDRLTADALKLNGDSRHE